MRKETIKAVKHDGLYYLITTNGKIAPASRVYSSRAEAYREAAELWPYRSKWHGMKVNSGYRITVERPEEKK